MMKPGDVDESPIMRYHKELEVQEPTKKGLTKVGKELVDRWKNRDFGLLQGEKRGSDPMKFFSETRFFNLEFDGVNKREQKFYMDGVCNFDVFPEYADSFCDLLRYDCRPGFSFCEQLLEITDLSIGTLFQIVLGGHQSIANLSIPA